MKLNDAARHYLSLGISTIPTDSSKRSIIPWKVYEGRLPTEAEIGSNFAPNSATGLAIICGQVSGNLEVVDCDLKYDITGTLWDRLNAELCELTFFDKTLIVKTISGGFHIYYRCEYIEGNQKLAQRYTTEEERTANPHNKVKVLFETRGQGGYVIAPPSAGYTIISGSFDTISVITADERDSMLSILRKFNEVIEEVPIHYRQPDARANAKSPFTDYNERGDIVALLQSYGWKLVNSTNKKAVFLRPGDTSSKSSGDYNFDLGLFSVFTTSSEFEPMKGYRPAAVFAKLVCNDNWKDAYRKLTDMGYGEPKLQPSIKSEIQKAIKNGYTTKQIASLIEKDERTTEKLIAQAEGKNEGIFDWQGKKRVILYRNYVEWLKNNNYHLFFYDANSPIYRLIHITDGKVREANNYMIKRDLLHLIETDDYENEDDRLTDKELLLKNPNLFIANIFEYLRAININWLRDTADTCYIPFRSTIIKIDKYGITKLNYGEFKETYIWESDLIVNEKCEEIDIFDEKTEITGQFDRFLHLICGQDDERTFSAYTLIGYILHKYKDPSRAWAVILGEETDDDTKGGGTGKGIFIKALEKILNTVTIDGKNFKADKSFAYQRVKLDTKLVAIQDVERNFDFEKFYSIITEGWTIEKKNKDELYISYQDSPKVILTTNYSINDSGHHAKRRQKVIEFSDYFGATRTPRDEFGGLLFDDWDRDEWNRFYNSMFRAVWLYFNHGVVDMTQGEKYRLKKLRTMFGEDFSEWFQGAASGELKNPQKFNELYKHFLNLHDLDKKEFSSKKFKKALQVACQNFGYELIEKRNWQDNGSRLVSCHPI